VNQTSEPDIIPNNGTPGTRRRAPARVAEADVVPPPEYPARVKKEFELCETFGIDLGPEKDQNGNDLKDAKGKVIKRKRMVTGYTERTPWTPDIDPSYEFPEEETKIILLALENKDRLLIHGHTGVGKTSILTQIAARLNYNVVRVSFDGAITRADLIGEWIVKGGEMKFMWGILPLAFRMPGTLIILDEWDSINGDCAFVLQRPLEKDDGRILVMETGGTLIPLHEDNVICATANTRGLGDDTGLYSAGTKTQNYAQLNRFQLTIQLTYMPEEKELAMLTKKFPQLNKKEIAQLVKAVHKGRKAYENNEVSVPLSPRDLINWTDKYVALGEPIRAAKYAFLNRMPPEDAATMEQIIQRSLAPTTLSPAAKVGIK
jgi:cobaltochelatase CobS